MLTVNERQIVDHHIHKRQTDRVIFETRGVVKLVKLEFEKFSQRVVRRVAARKTRRKIRAGNRNLLHGRTRLKRSHNAALHLLKHSGRFFLRHDDSSYLFRV